MRRNRWPSFVGCESLEIRRLLATTIVVNDTPGVDTITVGVTAAGGISTNVNGQQKDYAPGEFDALLVQSRSGADTINVRATVVPSIVHYLNNVFVNVGDAGGVQNIKATLNMNGVVGGPARPGIASIALNNGADTTARNVLMRTVGSRQNITGLAPAEISIGVEFEPVGPAGMSEWEDRLDLTTGGGADVINIEALRYGTPTTLFNTGGNDAIQVGAGSLRDVRSSVTIWGGALFGSERGGMTLRLDDSKNTNPAQFTLSALYIRDKGPMERIEFGGTVFPQTELAFQVSQVASATIDAGSGGNRFLVQDLPSRIVDAGPVLTLNTGDGNDGVAVDRSGAGTLLKVNAQAGDDLLKAGPIGPWDAVNGTLVFDGGSGFNTFIVQGPKVSPLAMPSVGVSVYAGRVEHIGVEYRYTGISRLTLQNGWFLVRENLGPIELVVTSEPSDIQFESPTAVVQVNASQKLTSLTIKSGAVEMSRGGDREIVTGVLDIGEAGTLDLADNQMEVNWNVFSPFAEIRKWIFAKKIFSSSADARHNLGYAHRPGGIDFAPFGTVLVRYTLYGDANLDRRVNFNDLAALAQHYNDSTGNRSWDEGDFTYDGNVDFADLRLLAQNYNQSMATVAAEGAVAARAAATSGRPVPAVRRKPGERVR